jgi:hypothetical protein
MQPNKTKLALQIGAVVLGALCASNSYADTFQAAITTIDDVEITERVELSFGSNMYTTAGTCTILAAADSVALQQPGGVLMNYMNNAGTLTQGTNYGDLSGTSCVTGDAEGATAGVWDISGVQAGTVSILFSQVDQSDPTLFEFSPDTGCYVNFNGDTTDDADSCDAFTVGNVITGAILAATAEDDASGAGTGSGASVAGELSFTVGGTVTVLDDLVAETGYDLAFQIDVTY